ncbi:serine hydrolase domain-containing protein [Microbacterium sp. JZ31]|uniref:serine hydrolase domain-containing protein n=1 Tax=Microbacterium sp. JZ31 TaxID=1906274 RepID=UPI0019341D7C|nr:serine hydrolase domain-containing protein [Microbacterium sp. JZ31]
MTDRSRAEAALRSSLERMAGRRAGMPAPLVRVSAPDWEFGFGDVDKPFHAASSGKLFTATLIGMLAEQGLLALDSPIGRLLPHADVAGLPAAAGVDVGRAVTVQQLLAHTSGIPDFFDPPRGRATEASVRTLSRHRDRLWTPADLLDQARSLPAVGRPGERFHYSDTGYVLLGRIAEEAGGESFAAQLRTRLFEPTGMERASTPYDSTLIPDDLSTIDVAPFWIEGEEFSRARCVSLDWAGGNVVATADDFIRFQRALFGGRLIDAGLLEHLIRPRRRFRRGIHYGAGIMTLRFDEFIPLVMRGLSQPVGHLGVWASHVFSHREHEAHVVLNFHSTSMREMNESFRTHARVARILAGKG